MELTVLEKIIVKDLGNRWIKLMAEAEENLNNYFEDMAKFGMDKAKMIYDDVSKNNKEEVKSIIAVLEKFGNPQELLKSNGFLLNHILYLNHKSKQFILSKNSRLNLKTRKKFEERVEQYSRNVYIEKVYIQCGTDDTFNLSGLGKGTLRLMGEYKEVEKFEVSRIKEAKEAFEEAGWFIVKENLEGTYFTAHNRKKDLFLYVQLSDYFKLLNISTIHLQQKGHGTGRTFKTYLESITPEIIREAELFAENFFDCGIEKRISWEQFKKINRIN